MVSWHAVQICLVLVNKRLFSTKMNRVVFLVGAGAEKAGYGAIMVTVDSPRVGNREADERNK